MNKSLEERFPSFFRKSKIPFAWELHYEDPEFGCNSLLVDSHSKYLDYICDYRCGIYATTTYYDDGTLETEVIDCCE